MSDQDESIFGSNEVNADDQSAKKEVNPAPSKSYENLLAMIVKDDGSPKYTSIDAAIRSIPHAQTHISTLEKELHELRAELEKRKSAEEVLESFKSVGQKNSEEKPSSPTLDLSQLDSIVERKLSEKETQERIKNNVNKVLDAMSAKYGEKADEIYRQAAKEAGLSINEMNRLAASSPSAVFKLAGIDNRAEVKAPVKTSSSINTGTIQPQEQELSARVTGNSTKDMLTGWRNAGTKAKLKLGVE